MALEMRQRLVIGEPSMMRSPVTNPQNPGIFPYVRKVELEEDRILPVALFKAIIPPYPSDKMALIKKDNVIRWEAGYWEDGRPLNDENGGYHLEFEGVIVSVAERSSYDGYDAEKLMRRGEYQDSLSIEIEARCYMYVLGQAPLTVPLSGDIQQVAPIVLAANGNDVTYGLTFKVLLNLQNVNVSELDYVVENAGIALFRLRTTDKTVLPVNYQVGIDTYFYGKTLLLRDPNDTAFLDGKYPTFVVGDNVISANLSPRAARWIQVSVRFYNVRSGTFEQSDLFPEKGHLLYSRAKTAFGGEPEKLIFDVEADDAGNKPANFHKAAENIYARIAGDGFVGKFLTFGYPPVHRGNIIIYAGQEPDMQKAVLVDKVVKTYDAENARFRQEITPGFTPSLIINPPVDDYSVTTGDTISLQREQYRKKIQNKIRRIIKSIRDGGGK